MNLDEMRVALYDSLYLTNVCNVCVYFIVRVCMYKGQVHNVDVYFVCVCVKCTMCCWRNKNWCNFALGDGWEDRQCMYVCSCIVL